jgi:hypothetical protein
MIRLRVDVDYAYASRLKSVCYLLTGKPVCSDYLGNAKVIAELVNASPKEVVTYWFFNCHTLPDKSLLSLIDNDRHMWGLHVVNDCFKERQFLEHYLGRQVEFFTVHGTERLAGQLLWGRKLGVKRVVVPKGSGLQVFDVLPTHCLDVHCNFDAAVKVSGLGAVISFHPEWLYRGNRRNRGGYFNVLKKLLEVN